MILGKGCQAEQGLALVHLLTGLDEDARDAGILGGSQLHLHFHGFKHGHGLTLGDGVAFLNQDGDNEAGHGRGNLQGGGSGALAQTLVESFDAGQQTAAADEKFERFRLGLREVHFHCLTAAA